MQFTFQSKTRFTTWIGSTISCVMISFFITFLVIRTIKLASGDDPFFSMTLLPSENEAIDLWKLDFMFAIEDLDPRVGQIQASHVVWDFRGEKSNKQKSQLNLIDCNEYVREDGTHRGKELGGKQILLDTLNLERKLEYKRTLCPADVDSLTVNGHYGSNLFEYVEIKVKGCELGEDCLPLEEVLNASINFVSLRSHPSLQSHD